MKLLSVPRRHAVALAACLATSCVASIPARAQAPAVQRLDPVVVTAARLEQPVDEALPSTTLITRGEIERSQSTDLAELLSRQTGVQFSRAGGPGAQSSLFVRGANSNQVLVLVDGVRMNTALSGAALLVGVPLNLIDRIEIVRGNLSSLYGSEAIGGVVQIFTRKESGTSGALDLEAGSGSYRSAGATGSVAWGATQLTATFGYQEQWPFSAIDTAQVVPGPFAPGANPDLDGNRNRSASLRAEHRLGEHGKIGLVAWQNRNDTDFDSTADGPDATHRESTRADSGQLFGEYALSERWRARLTAAATRDRSDNRVSVPYSFSSGAFEARNRQATWVNEVKVAPRVTAILGAEYLEQEGESTAYDASGGGASTAFDRRVASAWFGTNAALGDHSLQLNVRYDDYDDVGSATTGLIAYGYQIAPAWRVKAQWSDAFRAPSFNDLYYPYYGNPDLRPEEAESVEIGLRYAAEALTGQIAVFQTRTRDLIVYDPATFRAENIARARNQGLEVSGTWRDGPWRVGFNASFLTAEDEATDQRLLRRAPYSVNAALSYDAGRCNLGAELGAVGRRYDSDINTFARTELGAYQLLRVFGAWRVNEMLSALLRIENALDENYALVSGYNTAGLGVFAGVRLRM